MFGNRRPFLQLISLIILLTTACASQPDSLASLPTESVPSTLVPPAEIPATATIIPPTSTATVKPPTLTVPRPTVTAIPSTAEPTSEPVPPSIATTVETLVQELPSATGGLSIDMLGNIYVGDMGLAPARQGMAVWQVSPDGEFRVYAEGQGLLGASGNIFLPDGTLYQSSFTGKSISRITADGTVTQIAEEGLSGPVGLTVDEIGNLYVADCRGPNIDKIDLDGKLTTFAESPLFNCPNGITRDPLGNLYVLNFRGGDLLRVSPDGQTIETFATFPGGQGGHVVYGNGQLYVVARGANQIYTVSLAGEVTLLAGSGMRGNDDGPALESTFSLANDIVLSPDGSRLYVNQAADSSGRNTPSTIRVIHLE